jgi:hypothetical protein
MNDDTTTTVRIAVGCAAVFRRITPADGCHFLLFFFGFRKAWRYGGFFTLRLAFGSSEALYLVDCDIYLMHPCIRFLHLFPPLPPTHPLAASATASALYHPFQHTAFRASSSTTLYPKLFSVFPFVCCQHSAALLSAYHSINSAIRNRRLRQGFDLQITLSK